MKESDQIVAAILTAAVGDKDPSGLAYKYQQFLELVRAEAPGDKPAPEDKPTLSRKLAEAFSIAATPRGGCDWDIEKYGAALEAIADLIEEYSDKEFGKGALWNAGSFDLYPSSHFRAYADNGHRAAPAAVTRGDIMPSEDDMMAAKEHLRTLQGIKSLYDDYMPSEDDITAANEHLSTLQRIKDVEDAA